MARKQKQSKCRKAECVEPLYLGGLCRDHHDEHTAQKKRRETAIEVLHYGSVGGAYLQTRGLHVELAWVRKWWHRACDAVNYKREDPILRDEAEFALEWCIALAQEIVDADAMIREGREGLLPFSFKQTWVVERFRNLELGLTSNGTARR